MPLMADLSLVHRTHPARVGAAPHPGLLLLHGRGADELDLLPLASELDGRLLTVTARAPFPFPWGGYMWYDLDPQGVGYPEPRTLRASIEQLQRFLGELVKAYPIDPRRLYLGGFSMGAVMAGTLALLEPGRVTAAMMLSGYLPIYSKLPFQMERAAGHPFFVAHGTLDPVIPVVYGRTVRDFLAKTPVDLTYREYPVGHEIGYQELQDLSGWLSPLLDSGERSWTPAGEAGDTEGR